MSAAEPPVIGVTTYLTPARWGAWDMEAALVPADYVRGVVRAGGSPLLVPPGASLDATLAVVDGLVFSGGSDLDPELYGADAHPETAGVIRERDDFELELMRAALERDVPMLAICRGSQVLNVALGGDLEQHVPDRVGSELHREVPGVFSDHGVEVVGGTRLGSLIGDRHDVKSHHHQGFGEVGDGLVVAARAPDGTVEALEAPARRFTLGVLWHPEAAEDRALFEALVAEASAYRAARGA
ncbi:MAG TPA: gamma-glutamyl-gamma-aminobutyrate hydrolase family protein [Gaiellaceae bacterium]|jgi:gamma-glutamyl-gamma-aminobutyrate hydrolase PuuD|nr:gamma-glutamyl-gamma-aminobutyrate hydrolase family protein [Gaiellaceae bacterium]